MNLRDLEYLVALAEQRHFGRAAQACHVSQPTLSTQIRRLEESLGNALLERSSRKVVFTQSGLLLVEQAQKILSEVKILRELASQQGDSLSGPLHIGLIPTVAPYLLPYFITELRQCFPELELFLHETETADIIERLNKGQLDCGILALLDATEEFRELPLYDEPLLLAVPESHQWSTLEKISLDQLSGQTVLMLQDGHCLREQVQGYCFAAGALEDNRFRATSLETLRHMVAAGSGITLVPQLAVPNVRARDGVCYLKIDTPTPRRRIGLIHRRGSPLQARYRQLAQAVAESCPLILLDRDN